MMVSLQICGLLVSLQYLMVFVQSKCDQRPFGGQLKCCPGKDQKCFVKTREESNSVEGGRRICYCDEHCKYSRDCCSDYLDIEKQCRGSQDCRVGEWGRWTACSTQCGFGVRRRRRFVTARSYNGGRKCPSLIQIKGCDMKHLYCNLEKFETGFILPIEYRRPKQGTWQFEKILPAEKLDETNMVSFDEKQSKSYCVNYKLIVKRQQCQQTWADRLTDARPICVECQPHAMRNGRCKGEGTVGVATRWKALRVPQCHGDWIRLGPAIPDCTCSSNEFSNFVFV